MKLDDFNYELPQELIAQYRKENRDDSKLLVMDYSSNISDSVFSEIHNHLEEGDFLIFNDSKVIKSCINLKKDEKDIKINLNKEITKNIWSGFAKPSKKLTPGDSFEFDGNHIIVKEKHEDGLCEFEFDLKQNMSVFDFLDMFGTVPIPPYIRDGKAESYDEDEYQTIYSKHEGSVAAPTAGLHFSDSVFVNLNKKNIDWTFVTLHVGAGTFMPVKTENIDDHVMHSEYGEISVDAADKINQAKKDGRKIVCVGTTSLRTVEHSAKENGIILAENFETSLFIKPGFEFKIADKMITNFHMPKSSLMMLVSAFAGYNEIKHAYEHAKNNNYRFFSYGDACLLHRKE